LDNQTKLDCTKQTLDGAAEGAGVDGTGESDTEGDKLGEEATISTIGPVVPQITDCCNFRSSLDPFEASERKLANGMNEIE
jgi:hypothetical protein